MAIKSLDKIFKPERIALKSVSNNPKNIDGHCLEISKEMILKRIVAKTTADNKPMIAIFEKR